MRQNSCCWNIFSKEDQRICSWNRWKYKYSSISLLIHRRCFCGSLSTNFWTQYFSGDFRENSQNLLSSQCALRYQAPLKNTKSPFFATPFLNLQTIQAAFFKHIWVKLQTLGKKPSRSLIIFPLVHFIDPAPSDN